MRQFIRYSCLFFGLVIVPAAYADTHENARPAAAGTEQTRLDQLFADLKHETNEAAARRIAQRIRREWALSGGATADLLIEWAQKAASEEKYNVALDLLDQTVVLYPKYVEGWNSRALLYLMMSDYSRAMADLSRVLVIEPRHFGALSGLAGILRATDRPERAMDVYRRMLEVYPMQRSAQRALLSIAEEQADGQL